MDNIRNCSNFDLKTLIIHMCIVNKTTDKIAFYLICINFK